MSRCSTHTLIIIPRARDPRELLPTRNFLFVVAYRSPFKMTALHWWDSGVSAMDRISKGESKFFLSLAHEAAEVRLYPATEQE